MHLRCTRAFCELQKSPHLLSSYLLAQSEQEFEVPFAATQARVHLPELSENRKTPALIQQVLLLARVWDILRSCGFSPLLLLVDTYFYRVV